MDQNAVQQVNALQRELFQLNQQLRNVNTLLNQATTALNDAREHRLAAERNAASKQGTNVQQFTDLRYLYDESRSANLTRVVDLHYLRLPHTSRPN
jgi:flagellar hook-associated protein FlgK